jgi:hypothetical protein
LLITIKNSRHNLFGKEHLEAVRITAIEILFYKMVGDEDTIYWAFMFSMPGSYQGRSPFKEYMKPARPNTPTWSRRQKLFVNPNSAYIKPPRGTPRQILYRLDRQPSAYGGTL